MILPVKEQKDDNQSDERHKSERCRSLGLIFKLTAISNEIAFRKRNVGFYFLSDIIDSASKITFGDIGGDDDSTADILSVDCVRAGSVYNFSKLT